MKKILTFALAVSMMASLAASASALEYSIAPPKDFDFGRDNTVLQRIRRSRQSRCHAKAQAKGNDFFHSAVSSSSAFSFLCFTSSAPPTPAPAAATIPRGIST